MKSTLNNVLIFAVGAAIGSAVTWYFVKTKYERIAQEEIDSVREEFAKAIINYGEKKTDADEAACEEPEEAPADAPAVPTEKQLYNEMTQKLGYVKYSEVEPAKKEKAEESAMKPIIIQPEELGELGYQIIELSYWADGVITDAKNKRIKDVDELIGADTLAQFGKYEQDALHVRNPEKRLDFEILRDLKRYSDFFDVDDSPDQMEA